MKKLFLILFVFGVCFASTDKKFDLVMHKPKEKALSKNELKEQIGEKLKGSLDGCASVVERVGELLPQATQKSFEKGFDDVAKVNDFIGEILKIVGGLQKGFATKAQLLIENSRPFKKATKVQLEDTHRRLCDISKQLQDQGDGLKSLELQLRKELKKNGSNENRMLHVVKNVGSSLKSNVEEFKKIQEQVTKSYCLG